MLNPVYGSAFIFFDVFKMRRCKPGLFFELSRKMLLAAVLKLVGDFAEALLAVDDQLLGTLDLLQYEIPLDRLALDAREEAAQLLIVAVKAFGEVL